MFQQTQISWGSGSHLEFKGTDPTDTYELLFVTDMVADIVSTPAVWLTSLAIAGSVCLLVHLRLRKMRDTFRNIPMIGEYSFLFGNMMEFPKEASAQYTFLLSWLQKHRRMAMLWVGPLRPYVYAFHPDLAQTVLQSNNNRPAEDGDVFAMLRPWTGDGLLVANGKRWGRNRRLLDTAFHNDILRSYMGVFNKTADIFLENVDKMAETGQSFDIYPLLKLFTFDSILKCTLSLDLDVQRQKNVPYLKSCEKLARLWGERMTNILEYWDWAYNLMSNGREFKKECDFVHAFTDGVIDKRQQLLKTEGLGDKRYIDFLDILLTAKDDTGSGLTRAEIRAEVDTLMFAGQETTASAISWLLHNLTQHMEYQYRVQKEIDSLMTGRGSTDILWGDLQQLELLTCCMKESLRLFPSAPTLARLLTEDRKFDGVTVPSGTRVAVFLSLLHRNPDVWENPNDFCPERFLPENVKDRHPYAFIPFAAGARNCIGKVFAMNEVKVLTAKLLQSYELTPDPTHPAVPVLSSIIHSETGMWMYAKRRE